MILQALTRYYEDLAARDMVPKQGWAKANVSFAISLLPNGEVAAVTELTKEVQSGKKTVLRPLDLEVPQQVKKTSGVASNFLCENAAYMLGIDSKGKPERAKKCFDAAVQLHASLLDGIDHPAARAVTAFFEGWKPGEAESHPQIEPHLEGLKKGGNIVFRVGGEFVQDVPQIRRAWQNHVGSDESETGICLVTGEDAPLARLNPSIKGVRGAQSTGASLVSFNAEAYNSYGKEYGQNAPVGEYAAFAYGTALNHLLSNRDSTLVLGDMTIVFWAQGAQTAPQLLFGAFSNMDQSQMDEKQTGIALKAAMERLADGKTIRWGEEDVSPDVQFYILALAPNAARLSVRFFLRNTLGNFTKRLLEHYQRLEIIRPSFDQRPELSFWALLQETVNQNSRDKSPSAVMAGELMRAVLQGERYPATLLNGVMLRIRAEQKLTRGRAAIIKAYYLKNPHPDCPKEVLTVQLNDSKNIPYRLGRLFSVLEAIQQAANPGINATITDKYFNSASATPATVFPTLINLAQKHLRKLDGGLHVHYNKQLTEVLSALGQEFPTRLSLPEQGSFQLGYYHQTQSRYEKKEDKVNA